MATTAASPDSVASDTGAAAVVTVKMDAAPTGTKMTTEVKKKPVPKQPRRKEPLDCPLFLRKTYHMIDTCDSDVGGWTEDGDMFVVKDPEVFASKIIPQFFKHSNFASFVRQLNFYGFRKVKCDPIKLDTPVDEKEAKWWRFRHKNFQKDRLDLLNEMRRKDPNAPPGSVVEPGQEHVGELKTEVTTLKSKIETMTKDIDKLTSMMENMMKVKEEDKEKREECPQSSSSRTVVEEKMSSPNKSKQQPPSTVASDDEVRAAIAGVKKRKVANLLPNLATASDADFIMEDVTSSSSSDDGSTTPAMPAASMIEPASVAGREESMNSMTSTEQEFVNDLFNDLGIDDAAAGADGDMNAIPQLDALDVTVTSSDGVDPKLMRKLHDALSQLPRDMQELFVDRLVAAITNPESCRAQLEAVTALSAAAKESQQAAAQQKESTINLPLAAATLSALLAQIPHHSQKGLPIVPVHA